MHIHLVNTLALDGAAMPLALQGQRGDQALDLWRLAVLLTVLLLHSPVRVDVLAHIIVLAQVEELADLRCALGATHARLVCVSEPRDLASSCRTDACRCLPIRLRPGTCTWVQPDAVTARGPPTLLQTQPIAMPASSLSRHAHQQNASSLQPLQQQACTTGAMHSRTPEQSLMRLTLLHDGEIEH